MDDQNNKKSKGKLGLLLTGFGVCAAGLVGTFVLKDDIIINMGLAGLRALRIGSLAGTVLTGLGGGVIGVTTVSKLRDEAAIERKRTMFVEENKRKQVANLSVKDKLENSLLREMLREKLNEGWQELAEPVGQCISQLEQMDS